ncbi:hypothetical protein M0811_07059 [Anaeramoeba ignava]|uniref:Uncharacterized protein n=1 Tax=Anaeramoeba ignava TaxID=1746090 RepID=A0A9Q0RDJ9_ANAIG|nr:hypothetical protein M0811_07059 [Anaeramoeba ignava]
MQQPYKIAIGKWAQIQKKIKQTRNNFFERSISISQVSFTPIHKETLSTEMHEQEKNRNYLSAEIQAKDLLDMINLFIECFPSGRLSKKFVIIRDIIAMPENIKRISTKQTNLFHLYHWFVQLSMKDFQNKFAELDLNQEMFKSGLQIPIYHILNLLSLSRKLHSYKNNNDIIDHPRMPKFFQMGSLED